MSCWCSCAVCAAARACECLLQRGPAAGARGRRGRGEAQGAARAHARQGLPLAAHCVPGPVRGPPPSPHSLAPSPPLHRSGIRTPEGTSGRTFNGQNFYSTSTTSEEFVALSAYYLRRNPGQYTIYIMNPSNDRRTVMFGLQARWPALAASLARARVRRRL
jgi:hypothetical protein